MYLELQRAAPDPESASQPGRRYRRLSRAALALVGVLLTPSLAACEDGAEPIKSCGLQEGLYSHTPGVTENPHDFAGDLICSIDDTLAGESIKISTYKIHEARIADALTRAHQRGVNVQLVMDGGKEDNPVARELQQELGNDTSADSFMATCDGSCKLPGHGVQHAKVIVLPGVAVIGSSNLSPDNLPPQASGADMVLTDPSLREASERFVDSLTQPTTGQMPVSSSGTESVSFAPYDNPDNEPITKLLRATECMSVDVETNSDATKINIAMYDITWGRRGDIERVAELASEGCEVRIIINGKKDRFQHEREEIAAYLSAHGAKVIFPVMGPFMVHDKLVTVSGEVDGKLQEVTVVGSANITRNAVYPNTESTVISTKPDTHRRAVDHFNDILQRV